MCIRYWWGIQSKLENQISVVLMNATVSIDSSRLHYNRDWLIWRPIASGTSRYLPRVPVDGPSPGDHLSVSRTLCGALIFPSIASLVGRLLFGRMPSNLQRTILVNTPHVAQIFLSGLEVTYFHHRIIRPLVLYTCFILPSSFLTGWHRVRVDQGSAEGVFQAAAVHHSGQQAHPQLPRKERRGAEWRCRGGHGGQWKWIVLLTWKGKLWGRKAGREAGTKAKCTIP